MQKRDTVQRRLVKEAVCSCLDHPTAEEIYNHVKKNHPSISIATVYRNLAILCEMGVIRHVLLSGGPDRYDKTLAPHCHALCLKCGAFVDVPCQMDSGFKEAVQSSTGFELSDLDMAFRGFCPRCRV